MYKINNCFREVGVIHVLSHSTCCLCWAGPWLFLNSHRFTLSGINQFFLFCCNSTSLFIVLITWNSFLCRLIFKRALNYSQRSCQLEWNIFFIIRILSEKRKEKPSGLITMDCRGFRKGYGVGRGYFLALSLWAWNIYCQQKVQCT